MNHRPVYCASDGGSAFTLARSAVRRRSALPDWPQLRGRTVLATYLGRTAVWQLCRIWGMGPGDEVLMPAYNCGTEVDPFLAVGLNVMMYRVDRRARIDTEDVRRRVTSRTRVLYLTSYFGRPQPAGELGEWCRGRGIRIVEDCALSLFCSDERGPLGTGGDATVLSLRKFLPVPDGGVLTFAEPTPAPPLVPPPPAATFRNLLPLLKNQALRGIEAAGLYGPLRRAILRKKLRSFRPQEPSPARPDMPGDYYLREDLRDWSMSRISAGIARGVNLDETVKRRRDNYLDLLQSIRDVPGVTPLFDDLPPGVCPFALPVIVPRRGEFARRLNARGIAAFSFWEGYHRRLDWDGFPDAVYLKDNLLTLPVHQRFGPRHVAYIAASAREVAGELASEK